MSRKVGDLSVVVGTYQKDGQQKNKYQKVGVLMANDDGGQFILLNRFFNPAGVPGSEGKETVLVSVYQDNQNQQGGGWSNPPQGGAPGGQSGFQQQGGTQGYPNQGGGYGNAQGGQPPFSGSPGNNGVPGQSGGQAPGNPQGFEDDIPF